MNTNNVKILLASKSGPHIEPIHGKNRGQKTSRYCPFKILQGRRSKKQKRKVLIIRKTSMCQALRLTVTYLFKLTDYRTK
jgi:hypothetical protein